MSVGSIEGVDMSGATVQHSRQERHQKIKSFLKKTRDVAIAGFLFLLPVYIVFVIIIKAWTSVSGLGTSVAGMFGVKSIAGVKGSTVASGIFLIALWVACGLLVRLSLIAAFQRKVDEQLAAYIPGYETYKALAEEKLHKTKKVLAYTSALIRREGYWEPAFIVEQDGNGNYVVFVPNVPDTTSGRLLLARREEITVMASLAPTQLDASLKKMGKGLLADLQGVSEVLIPGAFARLTEGETRN